MAKTTTGTCLVRIRRVLGAIRGDKNGMIDIVGVGKNAAFQSLL